MLIFFQGEEVASSKGGRKANKYMNYFENNVEKLRAGLESIREAAEDKRAEEIKEKMLKWFKEIVLESYRNGIKRGKSKNAPKQQEGAGKQGAEVEKKSLPKW